MTSEPAETLQRAIRLEIAGTGPMPFARFMDLCLNDPQGGYYSRGLGGGGGRDYVTSSSLSAAYGALMARQAEEMWRLLGAPARFRFVEFGPGEGDFAADFLRAAAQRSGFAEALEYLLVEPSPALCLRQKAKVGAATASAPGPGIRANWTDLAALELRRVPFGCLFANEVLDALPVHRVVGGAGGLREIHVTVRDGVLAEVLLPPSTLEIAEFLDASGTRPVEGQEIDVCLAAPRFVARLGGLLDHGYAVLVDYGHLASDLYHPARRTGTLLAYHRHRTSEEFLERPGEQDLTAHVDFSAVMRAAEAAGMRTAALTSQARFLLALGALDRFESAGHREREGLKDLVLPDRMGGVFKVLVLTRGDASATLRGLQPPWRGAQPPLPQDGLRPGHLPGAGAPPNLA